MKGTYFMPTSETRSDRRRKARLSAKLRKGKSVGVISVKGPHDKGYWEGTRQALQEIVGDGYVVHMKQDECSDMVYYAKEKRGVTK